MGLKKSSKGKNGSKGKKGDDNGYITFLSELRPELKEEHPECPLSRFGVCNILRV
jgi:hypothetical protein